MPDPRPGLALTHNAPATSGLLDDLRSDERMEWVPASAWLTKVKVDSRAGEIAYDLAVDASGQGTPSRVAEGLDPAERSVPVQSLAFPGSLALVLLGAPLAFVLRRRALGH